MNHEDSASLDTIPEHVQAEANAWFLRLEQDDMNPSEEDAFVEWLNASATHQTALAEVEQLWMELGELNATRHVNEAMAEEATATADTVPLEPAKSTRGSKSGRWQQGLALAASVLFALVFGGDMLLWWQSDYRTGVGETLALSLEDGSRIVLNTNSALAVQFDGQTRSLSLLKGEAHFQVARDPARPFIVSANEVHTRALGTAFNVRLLDSGAEVVVTEHRVAVSFSDSAAALVEVDAGQKLAATSAALGSAVPVDTRRVQAWQQQRLIIQDRPLLEVIDELNRYYSGRMLIVDDELADLRVSGVFSTSDPRATLDKMADTLQFDVTQYSPFLLTLSTP
ncbi:MAG: FecR family protein [Pseudomonadota bacterium]